jgi:RluA family pseudouridine synthase
VNKFNFDIGDEQLGPKVSKVKAPEILFEDDVVVVIDKPAGLLSIPDRFGVEIPNAEAILRKKYGEIYVVHRLDKDTSGVMVFAKSEGAHKNLSLAFENRQITKKYLALVDGVPLPSEGEIEAPIGEDPSKAGKMKVDTKTGKDSSTSFKIVERFRKYSLLELNPKTGRQHQIRVHCAYIGHPLVVDILYGKRKELKLSEFKRGYKGSSEKPILGRLALHAKSLTFNHPTSGQELTFEAELPKDIKATLNQMRQHDCV